MRTGHLAPDPIVTGQGEFMARQEQAIKGFQRDHGLRQDGLINPKGPTHRSLLASLETMNDASNSSPETGDGAGMQAPQSEPSAADESQIAFLPALPLVPVALEGAAVFLGELLLGLGLAGAVLSLSGDTPKEEGEGPDVGGGDERANRSVKGYAQSAHSEALRERTIDLFLKPFYESRGDAYTERGNSIAVRACEKVMKEEFPELEGRLKHTHGATEKGEEQERLTELVIPGPDENRPKPGSARPDITFTYDDGDKTYDKDEERRLLINTVDVLKDGTTPTARERRALEKMPKLGGWIVRHMPKLRPGMDEAEYEAMVTEKCREFLRDVRDKVEAEKGDR
ncbi:MAG: hypothetical protein HOF34_13970 [Rhodospirillaceae bacterium]|nr:hypothetical protein [Rhodospirillaceae bacterium]